MGINFFCSPSKAYFSNCIKLGVFLFFSTLLLASCSISKPTYIFKDIVRDTVIKGFTETDIELKIQKNDLLSLQISSLNSMEDALFNASKGSSQGDGAAGYLVSVEGNIYLHKLGSILVAGMTRNELKIKLEKDLLPYLKDPIITVSFANHFITVMGEVGGSQILNMPAEKISLIDAIAKTGKVTENGSLKNVLVIRETPAAKEFKHLNLENASIITSPWYYLQPKDILVLNPNEGKIYKDLRRTRNMQLFTTFVSVLSIVLIIFDRIIKK